MSRPHHLFRSIAVSLGIFGCAQPPRAPQAPAVAPTAPPTASVASSTEPLQAPNVEALKAALAAEGYSVRVSAHDGRVVAIDFLEKPTTELPREVFVAVMKAHGDLLGYGSLGEVELGGPSGLAGPIWSMIGRFPEAKACPSLRYEAAFRELDAPNRAPMMWLFACPDSPEDKARMVNLRSVIGQMDDGRTDPFANWLRSEGLTLDKVSREPDDVVASPSDAKPLLGDRLAATKAFAERAAKREGLPPLDTVDLSPLPSVAPFTMLTLRLARPPLDGPCIDPRVMVRVSATARIEWVRVECGEEPVSGSKGPPDAGRTLPRAAAGSLPFVAICETYNFAWDYVHHGRVIDKRGDVYAFSGGPPRSVKSAHELAIAIRYRKHYVGTLSPGDVDALVSVTAQVEREPYEKRRASTIDGGTESCSLLRAGPSADALVQVRISESGDSAGKRVGPASTEAAKVLYATPEPAH